MSKPEVETLANERAELVARKYSVGLSTDEEDRLAVLTKKLEELLPVVSPKEIETLRKISEKTELILERLRERRQRLGLD